MWLLSAKDRIILDPFCGSGTAAELGAIVFDERLSRVFYVYLGDTCSKSMVETEASHPSESPQGTGSPETGATLFDEEEFR
jgi:hypothetical protein